MATVSQVDLRMELGTHDTRYIDTEVDFTLTFDPADINKRFRVQVELWADDSGAGEAGAGSGNLLPGPIYRFSFGAFFSIRDYAIVTARQNQMKLSFRRIIARHVLDEDPGKEKIVVGYLPVDIGRPTEHSGEIVIEVEQQDEVYAVVRLSPHEEAIGRSATKSVPDLFRFPFP